MLVNTQAWREAATHYQKYKRYDDGVKGSKEWRDYWDRETKRCLEGYSSGGEWIPGFYYHYLNYCPIMITEKTFGQVHNEKVKQAGIRKSKFPDVWDVDYAYFRSLDIAQNGITLEQYRKLPIDLGLIEDEYNLAGGHHLVWTKPRGVGAEQPHSEILITPTGEITMGDVQVGTQLYDKYGKITTVTEVLPQGKKEIWEVKLLDGRTVTCGANHLWTVVVKIRNGKSECKTLKTHELLEKGLYNNLSDNQKSYKYKIPKIEPVQFEEKELSVHPYIVGALLGDGAINGKNIKIATDDFEIVQKFQDILGKDYDITEDVSNNNWSIGYKGLDKYVKKEGWKNSQYGHNPLKRKLQDLKINIKCEEKFIPAIYKYGSVEQRLELVKGLMDTDGSVTKQGYCEFINKSKQLIDDLAYVLRSLGIYCSIGEDKRYGEKTITDRNGKNCTFTQTGYYRLYITTSVNIFNLKRKSDRINYTKFSKANVPIIAIRNTGKLEEQSCIIVDNKEHLYLTKDFIVTHNSFKGAALLSRNYHLVRESRGYIFASDKTFLEDDGIFSKFIDMRSFINTNAAGFKRRHDVKNDLGEMHVQASYYDDAGNPRGYMSDVFGISLKNDIQKGKGKRGQLIEWEELGKFPGADEAWEMARPSVEELDIVYGIMVGFGSGAVKGADYKALEKMSTDPESYNILCFKNKWDENSTGTKFAMFTPAYYNVSKKDKDGNSDTVGAKTKLDKDREIAKKSNDPTLYTRKCAENPYCPSEAFDAINSNIFPKAGLKAWRNKLLMSGKLHNLGVCGYFTPGEFGLKFVPSDKNVPLYDFPIKPVKDGSKLNLTGSVVLYQAPYRVGGIVPKNMYIICVDPYAQDESTGDSVGAAYVIKNINKHSKPDDIIVASYVGRPALQDDFADIVIQMAEYYGAKVGFENDRGDAFLARFKLKKKTYLLQEEFELQYNANVPKTGVRRTWGMHMASGKDDKRKQDGNKYIQEWLNRERGVDVDTGEIIYNYHFIYDPGLLEELIRYGKGNFDRVSALRIGMYHLKEIEYVDTYQTQEISPHKKFFSTVLYQ